MVEPRRNVAVLLAGGVGTRVGLDVPKQLLKIAGKPVMQHTLEMLDRHPEVDEIVVMMTPGHLDAVRAMIRDGGYSKVREISEGGQTRSETSMKALAVIDQDDCKVLLHDAVRPLLSRRIVSDCFAALDRYDAVDVAIPSADTIIEVNPDDTIRAIPRRANLRRGQTPQAFRLRVIREAYELAAQDPTFEATDDCGVVLRYLPDVPIWVVPGEERNMKVTEPIDIFIADKLFQLAGRDEVMATHDAAGYRRALEGRSVMVFGGSYGIGADIAHLASEHGAKVKVFSRSSTQTHVERRDDVRKAVAETLADHGSIDFVVNTAAVLTTGALAETSEETIYTSTEINYIGPILIAQECYPHLKESQGSLLLFTSQQYTRGRGGFALYASAKAGVVNLMQALADEWVDDGVRVNCISPERTGTPMRTQAFGVEPPGTLLDSAAVARASLDALLGRETGHVFDLRVIDPLAAS